jgi:DnaK suppressor protein
MGITGGAVTPRVAQVLTRALQRERSRLAAAEGARRSQVEAALCRLGQGTYGACQECGRPVDLARLIAIPWTAVCRQCAQSLAASCFHPL